MERPVRIYRSRKPVKTALTVFFSLLAVLILLAVAVFFGFKRYIVYTSEGVKLEVPWLTEPAETTPEETELLAPEGGEEAP